jgi:hypothetical protein
LPRKLININISLLALFFLLCLPFVTWGQQQIYEVKYGSVKFHSSAPRELIYANSKQLKGIVDIQEKTFAFRINITSFLGFNNSLQQEHFNESYMESFLFPDATFSGKIIEDVDLKNDGVFLVRAKGKLKIHGSTQERIVKVKINKVGSSISFNSDFVISLYEYNIKVPRVVYDKLSPEIHIRVSATLGPKKKV